ncbi:MAG: SbcC/MukB-like Walker B domain-containing protein [Eubacterium sp.]|nr:SbcC/MukB-like Walker B domain-containing protein [Eubacterium sp.]
MKKVQRLLLVHWYSYEKEIIEFGDINFLTGKTASGKSTIIDALQLLVLGDSSGSFFNKAANTRSVRTLKGYLFGETGDNGAGFSYLRNGFFTTYVALEFMDTEKKEPFVTGFAADCYSDQTWKSKWFILRRHGLPENLFIDGKTKVPFNLTSELRPFLNRTVGKKDYEFYDTNRAFQNALLGIYGQVKRKYLQLFKKAVPFTPITDIEQFITESICDVKNEIHVEDMQSEIRLYKQLEEDAARIRDRITRLTKIHDTSERLRQQQDTLLTQHYIMDRAEQEEDMDKKKVLETELESAEGSLKAAKTHAAALEAEIRNLETEIDSLKNTYLSSDIARREQELKQKLDILSKQVKKLEEDRDEALERIRKCGKDWQQTCDVLEKLTPGRNKEEGSVRTPDVFAGNAENGKNPMDTADIPEVTAEESACMDKMAALTLKSLPDFELQKSMDILSGLRGRITDSAARNKVAVDEIRHEIDELTGRAEKLKKGVKPYPDFVQQLKKILEGELSKKAGRAVSVHILADLLEIRDPSWQNAIEGYLDRQKFYLLVSEEYYKDALSVYNDAKSALRIYDAGLVDIGTLRKDIEKADRKNLRETHGEKQQESAREHDAGSVSTAAAAKGADSGKGENLPSTGVKGSLAEEIETSDPDARLYIDYLLGKVMKCENVRLLNQYRTSITKSCMLYKGYVARRLNPKRYETPYIGREAIHRQLLQTEARLSDRKKDLAERTNTERLLKKAAETEVLSGYEIEMRKRAIQESRLIPELAGEITQVQKEYDGLDFSFVFKLKEEIETKKSLSAQKTAEKEKLQHSCGVLEEKIRQLTSDRLPDAEAALRAVLDKIAASYQAEWIQKTGEPRFTKEQEKDGKRSTLSLRQSYARAAAATQTIIENILLERTGLRSQYNAEYKMPYDIHLLSNREYDKELSNLSENALPEYVEKIKNSREKAYDQFRDDFIAKLKSNIEEVRKQIAELNASLRNTQFGTDRYCFKVDPRESFRQYYDMIMDPLLMDTGGWNIASESFNKKYQREIDELFRVLILAGEDTSEAKHQEYEKNIQKYTDYRSYLVFDLIVTNEQGEEQRLSRMLNKKSGGETQIPFYISILASFSQVLRIRTKQNNTIRLIILDEAFSKLDGERIRQSIPLLREFGLQAVFSAPPDKIPDIAPLVDRNIAVYRDGHHSFTRHFDPKQVEEIPEADEGNN